VTIRVLVAEDEALIADDVRRTLGKLGYDVPKPAMTADEAIAAARELRPDLVLMDIRLHPPGDGIDAALEIRRRLGIPVVFLTAHSDEATLARAKTAEPYGYLLKPFEDRELRTTIELALHKHRLDARLAEQQRWFSTTLESLGDAVIATDPGGTISFLNPMAERLTNWKREDAIGRPIEEVFEVVGADGAPIESPIRTAMRSSVAVPMPEGATMKVKGGRVVTIDDSAAPIVDDSGHLLGGVVIFRDVTEKRKLEQRLALAERLALIGTLAAGVAHEINNPLTYVIGNVGLALEGLEASALELGGMRLGSAAQTVVDSVGTRLRELGQALREAAEGGERVRQIVADLKRFARTDERARRALELPQILDAAAKMTTHVVRHHARLLTEYGPTPPVEAVEGSLVQVFTNLLVNAAQAIGPGDAEHQEIRIRTATDAEGRAVVEIHDSGPGISAEALPQVFEPFFTTKPRGAGIGLGLAICRSIVSSLGGEIVAESRPGEGSTFRVSLPPARLADAGTTRPPAGDAGARRGRILVIDDEATVANAVERMLRRDHDVSIETDGRAAVERFARGERYDAVFCDLMMPEMSGMQVYDAIRKHDAAQAQRMVFMTGGSFAPSAREFLDRVGNLVLAKPFSIEEIRAAARELVG